MAAADLPALADPPQPAVLQGGGFSIAPISTTGGPFCLTADNLGIDEKNFGAGHSYISILTDLENSRVLEVTEDRTQAAADALWDTLSEHQRSQVEAVAMDMWEPFLKATTQRAPHAEVVHDKFHIASHLNEAVDEVRRKEHKELLSQGDSTLSGTRQLWLFNPENFSPEQSASFAVLRESGLKVARAWAAKELFTRLW